MPGDPSVADRDDPLHAGELPAEDGVTGFGELIRPSPVVGGQWPDPAAAFQPSQRAPYKVPGSIFTPLNAAMSFMIP